jgi:bile acid:Na+ symporter, BASS family
MTNVAAAAVVLGGTVIGPGEQDHGDGDGRWVYTGVELDVPVAALMGELALTVLVPTVVGVAIRTRWAPRIEPVEPVLSATASLAYLLLVVAVVGPNAQANLAQPATVAVAPGARVDRNDEPT